MDFHHGAPVKKDGSLRKMLRANSMPTDLPPMNPVPIRRLISTRVFQLEVFPDQREDSFFPADHHTGKDFHHVPLFRGRVGIFQ